MGNSASMVTAILALARATGSMPERKRSRTLMRAAVYREYGPPEVIRVEEIGVPIPADDEVRVRVSASTVCAMDWRARKPDPAPLGWILNGVSRPKRFNILGTEFAGTVEAIGRNATRFTVGDRVFGSTGLAYGAHAEYACVRADSRMTRMPDNISFGEAAAIPYAGVTALYFLKAAGITPGQKVLIYGASGNLGTAALQLAKHFGAHATAVCSRSNVELAKSLGADRVIDYTKDDFSTAGPVYDIILDAVDKSGFWRSMRAIKRGGVFVMIGPGPIPILGDLWARMTGAGRVIGVMADMTDTTLDYLGDLVARGAFRPVIGRRYPLTEIVEAHRYAEGGRKKGSVVIDIATV